MSLLYRKVIPAIMGISSWLVAGLYFANGAKYILLFIASFGLFIGMVIVGVLAAKREADSRLRLKAK